MSVKKICILLFGLYFLWTCTDDAFHAGERSDGTVTGSMSFSDWLREPADVAGLNPEVKYLIDAEAQDFPVKYGFVSDYFKAEPRPLWNSAKVVYLDHTSFDIFILCENIDSGEQIVNDFVLVISKRGVAAVSYLRMLPADENAAVRIMATEKEQGVYLESENTESGGSVLSHRIGLLTGDEAMATRAAGDCYEVIDTLMYIQRWKGRDGLINFRTFIRENRNIVCEDNLIGINTSPLPNLTGIIPSYTNPFEEDAAAQEEPLIISTGNYYNGVYYHTGSVANGILFLGPSPNFHSFYGGGQYVGNTDDNDWREYENPSEVSVPGGGGYFTPRDPSVRPPKINKRDLPKKKPKVILHDCHDSLMVWEERLTWNYVLVTNTPRRSLKNDSIVYPDYLDFWHKMLGEPHLEHSFGLWYYPDTHTLIRDSIRTGTPSSVEIRRDRYTIANMHYHPDGTPPSPLDLRNMLEAVSEYQAYEALYTCDIKGINYAFFVTDREKAVQFRNKYKNKMVIDNNSHFMESTNFWEDWKMAEKTYERLGKKDAWCYTLAYILEKYDMGIGLFRIMSGESRFTSLHVKKDEAGAYQPAKCP